MSNKELLLRAASELAHYITRENNRLRIEVNKWGLKEPEYHDMQTCHELTELAHRESTQHSDASAIPLSFDTIIEAVGKIEQENKQLVRFVAGGFAMGTLENLQDDCGTGIVGTQRRFTKRLLVPRATSLVLMGYPLIECTYVQSNELWGLDKNDMPLFKIVVRK